MELKYNEKKEKYSKIGWKKNLWKEETLEAILRFIFIL